MLRIGTTVVGVSDVARATRFWSEALGYVLKRDDFDDTFVILVPPGGAPGAHLALNLSETPVQEKPRIHLDLYAGDKADQEAEVNRLVGLGAQRVDWQDYPPHGDFIVIADTEGNRFCVIDTGA
jgi:catechol 2,3-dioxygenase-like lactoylglutathione lyase family enzyme